MRLLCFRILPSIFLFMLASCGAGTSDVTPTIVGNIATLPPLSAPVLLNPNVTVGSIIWPGGSTADGGHGQAIPGVACATSEQFHFHVHLTIIKDGVTIAIPENVGLQGCAYELHTHDRSGIVHIEAAQQKQFYLGGFFAVWGQPLSKNQVADLPGAVRFFITDASVVQEYIGDPAQIELVPHREITVVIGKVPTELPNYSWPPTL